MPEQFEVQRMAQYLKDHDLESQHLKRVLFKNNGKRILKNYDPSDLNNELKHKKLYSISTKAKYTFLHFESGTLVWHYRFTGIPHLKGKPYKENLYTLFSLPIHQKASRYCRMIMTFDNDELHYIDTRCLSAIYFFKGLNPESCPIYLTLAPDLNYDLNPSFHTFKRTFGHRKISVKQWLLQQNTAPSGIGNYLACEILAHAKLYPFIPLQKINQKAYKALCQAIQTVREFCMKSPKYNWFLVFNKEQCERCGNKVHKERCPKNSQMSHFCSHCQTLKLMIN
ncbi:MAG: DNA-formamidopyrimidine glycosylase family protein [bacterium]